MCCIPDKLRAEMIGILAWEAMLCQNFDSRVFIGPFGTHVDVFGSGMTYRSGTADAMLQHNTLLAPEPPSPASRKTAHDIGAGLLM